MLPLVRFLIPWKAVGVLRMERMVEVVVKSSIVSRLYNDWVMSKKRELAKSYRINWGVSPDSCGEFE